MGCAALRRVMRAPAAPRHAGAGAACRHALTSCMFRARSVVCSCADHNASASGLRHGVDRFIAEPGSRGRGARPLVRAGERSPRFQRCSLHREPPWLPPWATQSIRTLRFRGGRSRCWALSPRMLAMQQRACSRDDGVGRRAPGRIAIVSYGVSSVCMGYVPRMPCACGYRACVAWTPTDHGMRRPPWRTMPRCCTTRRIVIDGSHLRMRGIMTIRDDSDQLPGRAAVCADESMQEESDAGLLEEAAG